ncbi:unnamed protein product [Ostreobium quekettii]|uniref:Uncharacterized protein n=1 Tax=Ostreobium quekettii TaxID=121088 RepID=A0A8S1ILD8_9CHLO|nr:unnamed protein product [Ostreobium quekettii]
MTSGFGFGFGSGFSQPGSSFGFGASSSTAFGAQQTSPFGTASSNLFGTPQVGCHQWQKILHRKMPAVSCYVMGVALMESPRGPLCICLGSFCLVSNTFSEYKSGSMSSVVSQPLD